MSYHPDFSLLEAYAQGSIDAIHGVSVATHLEMCPHCRQQTRQLEEHCGDALLKLDTISNLETISSVVYAEPTADAHWQQMLEQIINSDVPARPKLTRAKAPVVSVNGRQITVPRALKRFVSSEAKWRSYGGKVFSLALHSDDNTHMNLMYISAGVSIPQHTHLGTESTLVLHGGFKDEDDHYDAGDFILRDGSVRHSPQTAQDQDCLCLTVLTEPMLFTRGVARLFNMFGKGLYP